MNREIKVGDTLYEKDTDRRGNVINIVERTVDKIGKKYFYVDDSGNGFDKYDLIYRNKNYSQYNRYLYSSMQAIQDEQELNDLNRELRSVFGGYGNTKYTLDQLRRIQSIINETHPL